MDSPEKLVSVLLETRGLVKQFGEFRAVDGVEFRVQEGEVLALIGSNGAGKTTLVNLISGLLRPDAGAIHFRGADVTAQSVPERIAAGIARSFQLVNLFDQLSALDNVALSIFSRQGKTRKLWTLAEADRRVWQEALEVLATPQLADESALAGHELAARPDPGDVQLQRMERGCIHGRRGARPGAKRAARARLGNGRGHRDLSRVERRLSLRAAGR